VELIDQHIGGLLRPSGLPVRHVLDAMDDRGCFGSRCGVELFG
jgi:hypothetical protein